MSVTAAAGFVAGGTTAGLKPSGKPDLALVVNTGPEQVAAVGAQAVTELGGDGDAAGGGEGLGHLVLGEVVQGPFVHQLGVRAERHGQHEVGQVDGLAPRRGADGGEGARSTPRTMVS